MAHAMITGFAPNICPYSCNACVQFPMIDPDALTARAKVYLDTLREPDMPEHHAALRPIVACAIKSDRVFLRFDSGAEAIKMNNNLQRLGGVGTFVDRHTHRRAQIPMRCCRSCRALYALPQDVKDAATSLGMPSNAGSLTDERIQDVCVGSMYNAYNSLSIQKAEVYCFKDFVVMIDLTGNIDVERLEQDKNLPVFDVFGLLNSCP